MSEAASSWAVVGTTQGISGEDRSYCRSREEALDAACDAMRIRGQNVLRIEGPNDVVIGREAIDQHCKSRSPRRP